MFLKQVKTVILKCFLKNVNMFLKENKIPKYIIDDIKISSDSDRGNSDKENSDAENSNEENSNEENFVEETKKNTNITINFFK